MAQIDFPELRAFFDKHREVVKMMKTEKKLVGKLINFKVVYYKQGKKISELKDASLVNNFPNIIMRRYELNEPDLIVVTWYRDNAETKVHEQTFEINPKRIALNGPNTPVELVKVEPVVAQVPVVQPFQGLGEAEVSQIVERRLVDIRRNEDHERLKDENNSMKQKLKELTDLNEELEKDKAAKETTQNYMRIVGMALPGLSKFFGGASLLSMLAGTEDEAATPAGKVPTGEREDMIGLLTEFMQNELNEQEVASLYMLIMEIQKDKNSIQYLLTQLSKGKPHAPTI